jgi:PAS domain-containing protein
MSSTGSKSWEMPADEAPAWRIERRETPVSTMPFFPDQNGGVYEKLLANLPVMLHCMDGSGRMISANGAWCETLGYTAKDIIGRSFSEFLPLESRSKLVTEIYPKFLVTSGYRNAEILIHRKLTAATRASLSARFAFLKISPAARSPKFQPSAATAGSKARLLRQPMALQWFHPMALLKLPTHRFPRFWAAKI